MINEPFTRYGSVDEPRCSGRDLRGSAKGKGKEKRTHLFFEINEKINASAFPYAGETPSTRSQFAAYWAPEPDTGLNSAVTSPRCSTGIRR